MSKTDEVIQKITGHMEGERHSHPSYGSLVFNRVSGGDPNLFGSSVKHHDKINLVLRTCEYDRGLHQNWYHPKEELFEVEMSYTQFVDLITHMNMYEGVPVTIKHILGERTPKVPYYNPVEVHKKEFNEQMEKTVTESKGEIEAFWQHKMYQIAQQAMVENPEKYLTAPVDVPGVETKRPKLIKVNGGNNDEEKK